MTRTIITLHSKISLEIDKLTSATLRYIADIAVRIMRHTRGHVCSLRLDPRDHLFKCDIHGNPVGRLIERHGS